MAINAVRVPLINIVIDAWAEMTVSTSVVVNQSVLIAAQSSVSIYATRVQFGLTAIAAASGMSVDAVLKWTPESDTPETWSSIPDTSEVWTAVSDASTSWDAQSDTPETWTPISENSETWQIAA
ncbi:hypothetical protein UFOVP751_23 [uncultured Caudovirales phage]|uniref:Uncharacterized protein n=1 Tax=uncultured Caudovirales phage TaxID=2100421 RepID=A0A6J7XQ05_9CAUD|nr:hypothetical protein UFOVP751_23 [uncultured Caudovirales phage]